MRFKEFYTEAREELKEVRKFQLPSMKGSGRTVFDSPVLVSKFMDATVPPFLEKIFEKEFRNLTKEKGPLNKIHWERKEVADLLDSLMIKHKDKMPRRK